MHKYATSQMHFQEVCGAVSLTHQGSERWQDFFYFLKLLPPTINKILNYLWKTIITVTSF